MDRNVFLTLTVRNVPVALRKESVDRNWNVPPLGVKLDRSLSARRAWIEIKKSIDKYVYVWVALRKESVDRNSIVLASSRACTSRSPQGERG